MDKEIGEALAAVQDSTAELLDMLDNMTETQVRAPSLLPGWTRGHVLTHIARNADGYSNLLRWASTGTEIPMYASAAAREADIEAGSARPLAALVADIRDSAAAFAAEAAKVPDAAWEAQVRGLAGGPFPASKVLPRRRSEVEIHRVDLAAGYTAADWPDGFAAGQLPDTAEWFMERDDVPACRLFPDDADLMLALGPSGQSGPALSLSGTAAGLLAWLTGRGGGADLTVHPPGPLPVLPDWR